MTPGRAELIAGITQKIVGDGWVTEETWRYRLVPAESGSALTPLTPWPDGLPDLGVVHPFSPNLIVDEVRPVEVPEAGGRLWHIDVVFKDAHPGNSEMELVSITANSNQETQDFVTHIKQTQDIEGEDWLPDCVPTTASGELFANVPQVFSDSMDFTIIRLETTDPSSVLPYNNCINLGTVSLLGKDWPPYTLRLAISVEDSKNLSMPWLYTYLVRVKNNMVFDHYNSFWTDDSINNIGWLFATPEFSTTHIPYIDVDGTLVPQEPQSITDAREDDQLDQPAQGPRKVEGRYKDGELNPTVGRLMPPEAQPYIQVWSGYPIKDFTALNLGFGWPRPAPPDPEDP